jgi:hypothetical protein
MAGSLYQKSERSRGENYKGGYAINFGQRIGEKQVGAENSIKLAPRQTAGILN